MLLFNDEASFYRQPTQAWVYAPKGREQPPIAMSCRSNTKTRIMAVLNAFSGEVLFKQASRARVRELAPFYAQVISHYKEAKIIYLVWDNWPVHYHKDVMKVLDGDKRVRLLPLPTYSPWLNPIEKLWRWLKQRITHAHNLADQWDTLKERIALFLTSLNQKPDDLLKYVGLAN